MKCGLTVNVKITCRPAETTEPSKELKEKKKEKNSDDESEEEKEEEEEKAECSGII